MKSTEAEKSKSVNNLCRATVSDGQVTLRWVTQTEVNNVGFNIYRSDTKDGKFVKINKKLFSPARGGMW